MKTAYLHLFFADSMVRLAISPLRLLLNFYLSLVHLSLVHLSLVKLSIIHL